MNMTVEQYNELMKAQFLVTKSAMDKIDEEERNMVNFFDNLRNPQMEE